MKMYSNSTKRNQGFTIIELVVVIVILGIVSVTAANKFLNLQGDARISSLQGLRGGMQGAADMVYPIAVQQGLEKLSAAEITIEGDKIQLVYGYPAADSANAWSHLIEATFADSIFNADDPADWYFHNTSRKIPWIRFMTKTKKQSGLQCYLEYTEATSTAQPTFELTTSGC